MVNLLGFEHSDSDYSEKRQKLAEIADSHVHWYGKTGSSPGRKLGHVTVLSQSNDRSNLRAIAETVERSWYPQE